MVYHLLSPVMHAPPGTAPKGPTRPVALRTILLAEDDKDIRNLLRQFLEENLADTHIVTAHDGSEAIDRLQEGPVDLIIADYKMPEVNGLELLKEACRLLPETPRVIITAFPDMELALRSINEAHVTHFFVKPLDPEALLQVVRARLARPAA